MRPTLRLVCVLALVLAMLGQASEAVADLDQDELATLVLPPYRLGQRIGGDGVWTIETSGGGLAGYIFESWPLAPIPGFSGAPLNLLITLDKDGGFLDVTVLEQNEPIFVSGLGIAPFEAFLRQYRGHSVGDSLTVDTADRSAGAGHRAGSTQVYLDGVTKATASVRIANEAVVAAALKVARERMQGIAPRPAALPRLDYHEPLDWPALVAEGIARSLRIAEHDVQAAFAGSLWAADDPAAGADPEAAYLDLWVVDVGPTSVARAVLAPETIALLEHTLHRHEEPILLLANGRQRLVESDFVRNTVPDRLAARQDGVPVALRDADVETKLASGVPDFAQAMILRADTRLGFDPASPWTLVLRVVREHGSFRPETATRDFEVGYQAPERFFAADRPPALASPWRAAVDDRAVEIALMGAALGPLGWLMARRSRQLASHRRFALIRLIVLAFVVVLVGWYAQGQLSIVTPLAVLRSAFEGRSPVFLLYDPFLLALWAVTLVSLLAWGRGFFCGWLCPYGALQEFADRLGRLLRLPRMRVHPRLDRALKRVKYAVLLVLIFATLTSAPAADALVEVEPFKTAVTLIFDRSPPFVLYAVFWLGLGLLVFKPFCRYVCPLGGALALAGKVRRLDWIDRRDECGAPCQFCKARCNYGAIAADGRIDYDECFQCLDCVAIFENPKLCIPERLALEKGRRLLPARR